jgi:hypothetical protein
MAPAAPEAPAAGPKFTWGGLMDAYYMFLFNLPDGANTLIGTQERAFDWNTNSATMGLAALSLNASMDPVSFQLDMGYGGVGTIINIANVQGTAAAPIQPSFVLLQAYGSISLLGKLSLDFGKFYTTAGAEVIPANKNWNYSRSLLFNAIPLLHTGFRANFKVNDMLALQASLVNGWNDDPDSNAWKTVGFSASITPAPIATIVATTYIGKEGIQTPADTSTPGDVRILVDLVAALNLTDKFGVNVNFDYIKASPSNASDDYTVGVAGMARYVLIPNLYVAARGEWLRRHVATINTDLKEFTITLGVPVGKNFELRPEFRGDFSNQMSFNGQDSQLTGTVAALAFF